MNPRNYNRNLLLSVLVFTIHNIEEAIGTAYFVLPADIGLPIELPRAEPLIGSVILYYYYHMGLCSFGN